MRATRSLLGLVATIWGCSLAVAGDRSGEGQAKLNGGLNDIAERVRPPRVVLLSPMLPPFPLLSLHLGHIIPCSHITPLSINGDIWFGDGPYKSKDDAKLARSTIRACPALTPEEQKAEDSAG